MWLGQAAVRPNPACSGHGFAVGCRWRLQGKVASPAIVLDSHAVPLTPSLGRWRWKRKSWWAKAGRVLGTGGGEEKRKREEAGGKSDGPAGGLK